MSLSSSSSSSSSKSKSLKGSLAKSYALLLQNREKKKNEQHATSQPKSATASMKAKIDAFGEKDQQASYSPIAINSEGQVKPQKVDFVNGQSALSDPEPPRHQGSALKASAVPQTQLAESQKLNSSLGASIEPEAESQGASAKTQASVDTLSESAKSELAASLIDPKLLWEDYFSGLIDDAADAVEENVAEKESELCHSLEVRHARRRGEHRFGDVCNFPLKLIFTPLKRGRGLAKTFASLLEMEFGPLHAALQVGRVVLEWSDNSMVTPYPCDYEDEVMKLDMQPYSEWVKYTGKHHSEAKKTIEGLDYAGQIELTYKIASEKKRLLDALIEVIIQYNKFHYYNLFDRNCQHFVSDALEALKVELPAEFKGGLGKYYKALIAGKTPSVPSKFKTHSHLDLYIKQKQEDGTITSMPEHDLEFILALYFRFHLESKTKLKKDRKALDEWHCEEEHCRMQDIEGFIELQSMAIHNFKTIS